MNGFLLGEPDHCLPGKLSIVPMLLILRLTFFFLAFCSNPSYSCGIVVICLLMACDIKVVNRDRRSLIVLSNPVG